MPERPLRFQGLVYRAHNPLWAWEPLSGEGARQHGGRFNRRGLPALYTALSPLTAIREASPFGRPMQPLTLCAYTADLSPVLDTRERHAWTEPALTQEALDCPTWERDMTQGRSPASQILADRLIDAGYVAMIVPSFARGATPDDMNMVIWRWNTGHADQLLLIDETARLKTLKDALRR